MGVDCRIVLPGNVRVDDVANVMGILCGMEKSWGGTSNTAWVEVKGVKLEPYTSDSLLHTCLKILIEKTDNQDIINERDGQEGFYVSWNWEYYGDRLMMPRATTFWIAIGKKLVEFFGGYIDYNDCDNTDINFKRKPKSNKLNCPEDGKDWNNLQKRIFEVKPLTKKDFDEVRKFACYQ